MTKKILFTSILSFLLFNLATAQYEEEISTIRKQFAEISKGVGYTESIPHFADEDCRFTINVKKKGKEISMIELKRMEDTRSYSYQYYYKNDNLFFVYTRNDINEGEDENGKLTFRVFEYRHYFDGTQCIKSLYRGFKYQEKEPNVKSTEFFDYFKAYNERELADKLLEYGNEGKWDKICGLVVPI